MAFTKTNPAYAHLAYRHAIVVQLVDELRENYMALSSDEPRKGILCGEVYQEDATVPADEIQLVVEELEEEAHDLELEMRKFTFSQGQQTNGLLSSKKAKASVQDSSQASPKKGRRKGSGAGGRGGNP